VEPEFAGLATGRWGGIEGTDGSEYVYLLDTKEFVLGLDS